MQEVFVHGLLGGARHGRRLCDQRAVGIEAARSVAPAVVDVAAFVPIPCDGVPVEPIAPADLAEVRLQPELPVHVQLAHDVPLFQSCSFLPVLLGGKSVSTLGDWRKYVGTVGATALAPSASCVGADGAIYIGINTTVHGDRVQRGHRGLRGHGQELFGLLPREAGVQDAQERAVREASRPAHEARRARGHRAVGREDIEEIRAVRAPAPGRVAHGRRRRHRHKLPVRADRATLCG